MRLDVYVPLLVSVFLGLAADPVAHRLPPITALRLLVPAGLAAALCWGWALALLGFTAIGQLSFVAAQGHWSQAALRGHDPVSGPIAWTAATVFVLAIGTVIVVTIRRVRAILSTRALARQLCAAHPAGLVVLEDTAPHAFALPGPAGGRIVASTAMLTALDPAERRVLFAHEQAHLTGRHHLWLTAAGLAAAADPLLARLPGTVSYLIERCADEAAATILGDRRLVARAICHAGLATLRAGRAPARPVGAALAFGASQVQNRIHALLARPAPARPAIVALIGILLLLAAIAAIDAGGDIEHLFVLAKTAYWSTHAT